MTRPRHRPGRLLLPLVLLSLALLGCGAPPAVPPLPVAPAVEPGPPAPDPPTSGTEPTPPPVGPGESGEPPIAGMRISMPSIQAESSLIPLGLNPDRTIQAPPLAAPRQAGLYRFGPVPGDPGPAVVLGHINSRGELGVFARLAAARPGDVVEVVRADGRPARFAVYDSVTVRKEDFPTSRVYGDTAGAELRLISCGGAVNPAVRSYDSNVIVFARAI